MASRLLNIRLDDARFGKVRRLRASGVTLSDVVREAIDARFEALVKPLTTREVASAVAGILERYPDPGDWPPRSYDVHDRRTARAAVQRALARRSR